MRVPDPGELTKRVQINAWSETPNASGALDRSWSNAFVRWAKVEVVGSQQFWGTTQIQESITHRFWFRYEPHFTDPLSLTGQVELKYSEGVYRIKRVSDFEERHVWTLVEAELLGRDE